MKTTEDYKTEFVNFLNQIMDKSDSQLRMLGNEILVKFDFILKEIYTSKEIMENNVRCKQLIMGEDGVAEFKILSENINLTLEITNLSDEQQESIKTASAITYDGITFVRKDIASDWMVKFAEKQVKNNKRISATGARINVKNYKTKTDFQKESETGIIYDTITNSSKAGFHSVYIKDINISDEIKSILESDGFAVKTNYTRGFEIKWEDENNSLK